MIVTLPCVAFIYERGGGMYQERWKSVTAFGATLALVVFVLKNYFGVEIPKVDELIDLILACVVAYGIYNNPCNSIKY
jgi:hypothetical protein